MCSPMGLELAVETRLVSGLETEGARLSDGLQMCTPGHICSLQHHNAMAGLHGVHDAPSTQEALGSSLDTAFPFHFGEFSLLVFWRVHTGVPVSACLCMCVAMCA